MAGGARFKDAGSVRSRRLRTRPRTLQLAAQHDQTIRAIPSVAPPRPRMLPGPPLWEPPPRPRVRPPPPLWDVLDDEEVLPGKDIAEGPCLSGEGGGRRRPME